MFSHADIITEDDLKLERESIHEMVFDEYRASIAEDALEAFDAEYADFSDLSDTEQEAALELLDPSDREMLRAINCAENDVPDWGHGASFIHDNHFEDYARELADSMGVSKEQPWPLNYIDWERAAEALKMDYTSIEIAGHTYWTR